MVVSNEVATCEDDLVSVPELDISGEDVGVELASVEVLLD
jgi:hypothetical protein